MYEIIPKNKEMEWQPQNRTNNFIRVFRLLKKLSFVLFWTNLEFLKIYNPHFLHARCNNKILCLVLGYLSYITTSYYTDSIFFFTCTNVHITINKISWKPHLYITLL